MVSGTIGDDGLGLAALRGVAADPSGVLSARYHLPQPRVDLRDRLRSGAHAACDVSDGLVADAGHIASASGVALRLDLERIPLSPAAAAWLAEQRDRGAGLIRLATSGDDYEVLCAGPKPIEGFTVVGEVIAGAGVDCRIDGVATDAGPGGWRHV
jgi:thiamine-monophosphate kinase